jgi:hypothetical protein
MIYTHQVMPSKREMQSVKSLNRNDTACTFSAATNHTHPVKVRQRARFEGVVDRTRKKKKIILLKIT